MLEYVRVVGPYLAEKLEELTRRHDCIETHRGVGLLQGLVFNKPVGEIINRAMEKGLILINAGTHIIRFVPALIISKADVDAMAEILDSCIEE